MHEMSSLITAVIGKICILNTNAGPRTNRNKRRYHPRPVEDDFVSALHGSGRPRLAFFWIRLPAVHYVASQYFPCSYETYTDL